MNTSKRMVPFLAIALLAALMAACSSGSGEAKNSAASGGNTASATVSATPPASEPAKPDPAVIKIFMSDMNDKVPEKDDLLLKYIEEKTNTDLEIEFLPHAKYEETLKLKFASGDFPDVYQSWSGPEPELIEGGKVIALNDLVEKHGANLRKYIPQATWDAVTVQGKIYSIPQPTETAEGQILFIRQDWLDKLNLKVPTTSDELLNVMRAFRDGDPNGNKKKDEIPFTMRENITWGEPIFGMWGVGSFYSETLYNDEVILGNVHPNMVKGLEYLQTMYKEKLLDSEFLTNNRAVWEQKIKSGLVGMWAHAPNLAWQWQQDLAASLPDAKPNVMAIPTPKGTGYDGPVGTRWSPVGKTFTVTSQAKDPEAIVRLLDWLISEEGQVFTELGIEGQTYQVEGGKKVYDNAHDEELKWLRNLFRIHGFNQELSNARLNDEQASLKINTAFKIANEQGFKVETIGMPPIENDYNMVTMFRENAAKLILGQASTADYQSFVEAWKSQGGAELIKSRTEWYNQNRK
ncbi:extracellular solute-binding protein [Cohnella sp. CFH 77786]|uniref:extracellular solute-binding protein n=1 Tax=Cohnella sp. CFH 77786 TaxID=2662265 RepID=UPI001C60AC52|nr:extracellular solute-binding protein [Cohnella sp. CFH 77786]MBW5444816.1 extracellular solute-binding protein [Cohnella sp. CFH 77786]